MIATPIAMMIVNLIGFAILLNLCAIDRNSPAFDPRANEIWSAVIGALAAVTNAYCGCTSFLFPFYVHSRYAD
jgi:hypothetical protein